MTNQDHKDRFAHHWGRLKQGDRVGHRIGKCLQHGGALFDGAHQSILSVVFGVMAVGVGMVALFVILCLLA